ncbi:Uncharacterized protein APZ42_011322 [Daphnia magna]|uniref:Uncharacterized protein n=1 Tax=Daphnia magna TaxID=35525 RepID=A0A162SKC8_9CRUS|nr:Uncharacterized protein APZ42_011322 [Daphnia magna]
MQPCRFPCFLDLFIFFPSFFFSLIIISIDLSSDEFNAFRKSETTQGGINNSTGN